MCFWRENAPPAIKKPKENSGIKKEETVANFSDRDIKKHHDRQKKNNGVALTEYVWTKAKIRKRSTIVFAAKSSGQLIFLSVG